MYGPVKVTLHCLVESLTRLQEWWSPYSLGIQTMMQTAMDWISLLHAHHTYSATPQLRPSEASASWGLGSHKFENFRPLLKYITIFG